MVAVGDTKREPSLYERPVGQVMNPDFFDRLFNGYKSQEMAYLDTALMRDGSTAARKYPMLDSIWRCEAQAASEMETQVLMTKTRSEVAEQLRDIKLSTTNYRNAFDEVSAARKKDSSKFDPTEPSPATEYLTDQIFRCVTAANPSKCCIIRRYCIVEVVEVVVSSALIAHLCVSQCCGQDCHSQPQGDGIKTRWS
jgi:hypothetical protein